MPSGPESNGAVRPALLVLEGIETFYGSIQALKGISFTVPERSIVCMQPLWKRFLKIFCIDLHHSLAVEITVGFISHNPK